MAGDDHSGIGEGEKLLTDRADEGGAVAAGQVGTADRAGKEGVAGEEQILGGQMQADAALGVAGCVEDVTAQARNGDDAAVFEGVVGRVDVGGGHAEPTGLHVHHLDQGKIAGIVEDGRAGQLFQAGGAGDVVDVGVGNEDLLDGEAVLLEEGDNAGDVVAGINDDGFAGVFIAQDRAVALQHADGEDLVDHKGASL